MTFTCCFACWLYSPKRLLLSPSQAASSSALVSEATVDSFLKQMFGWNQDLTWKIAEIKPAEAAGFTEVTAVFNTPQGQQVFRVYRHT